MRVGSLYRRPYRIAAFCGRIKARTRIIPSFIVINKGNTTSFLNKAANGIRASSSCSPKNSVYPMFSGLLRATSSFAGL